jgi:hypothetical protein
MVERAPDPGVMQSLVDSGVVRAAIGPVTRPSSPKEWAAAQEAIKNNPPELWDDIAERALAGVRDRSKMAAETAIDNSKIPGRKWESVSPKPPERQ